MLVLLIVAASLAAFLLLFDSDPAAAYFLTPMRVWELGIGVAMYLASLRYAGRAWVVILDRFAPVVVLLLLSCLVVPVEANASVTLAAVVLTALLLPLSAQAPIALLFAHKPVVYVGKLSYSLYLWHWPVLVLGPFAVASQ